MAEKSFPYNAADPAAPDRTYNADDVAEFDQAMYSDGVVAYDDQLAVTAGTGMESIMDTGFARIRGRSYHNPEPKSFTHDPADGVLDRIDRIVLRESVTNRSILSFLLKGTADASPTAPALTRTTDVWEIAIADIPIAAGATEVTTITDKRADATVCGMVAANITLDTTTFDEQGAAAVAHLVELITAAEGGSLYDLIPTIATDITVEHEDFDSYTASGDAETRLYDAGYVARAAVAVDGVISGMRPFLTFDTVTVDECGADIKNQYQTYNGGVYVYADREPDEDIIILTAEFRKAVS